MRAAITPKLIFDENRGEILQCLDFNWGKTAGDFGIELFTLNYAQSPKVLLDSVNFDLVIFSGGNDLSQIVNNDLNCIRQDFEKELLKLCLQRGIKVLAVCKGAQLVASTMDSHFYEDRHVGKFRVDFQDFSEDLMLYHNYCFDKISKGEILAKCGKSIEGFALKDEKITAIMWHPEREKIYSKATKNIFDMIKE